jgi:hypothetical protein
VSETLTEAQNSKYFLHREFLEVLKGFYIFQEPDKSKKSSNSI